MCGSERNAFSYQVVSKVCRVGKTTECGSFHIVFSKLHGLDHAGERNEYALKCIDHIEKRLLHFLHVLVIGERKSLHGDKKRDEVAIYTAGLSTGELGNIRILLLRHHGRSRGISVIKLDELEFLGRIEDDLFGKTRQVHHEK